MKVKMIVDFIEYKKGEIVTLPDSEGKRYIDRFGVATIPPASRKKSKAITAAPVDKQVAGAPVHK